MCDSPARIGCQDTTLHLKTDRSEEQFIHGPEGLRPRNGYVTEQLFKRVEQWQAQVQAAQAAPREDSVEVTGRRQGAGVPEREKCLEKPWPWLFQVEHWLFGVWPRVDDGTLRGPHCGGEHVARKSQTPRLTA